MRFHLHGLLYFFTDGPEVSTVEINNRSMHASEDLTLRCDFDSVPIPSVDWVHNDTIDLDNTSSRVSIMTTVISENRGISILKLSTHRNRWWRIVHLHIQYPRKCCQCQCNDSVCTWWVCYCNTLAVKSWIIISIILLATCVFVLGVILSAWIELLIALT